MPFAFVPVSLVSFAIWPFHSPVSRNSPHLELACIFSLVFPNHGAVAVHLVLVPLAYVLSSLSNYFAKALNHPLIEIPLVLDIFCSIPLIALPMGFPTLPVSLIDSVLSFDQPAIATHQIIFPMTLVPRAIGPYQYASPIP
jgi:hypothetical protein